MLREVTYAEGKQAVIEVRGEKRPEAQCFIFFMCFFFQSGGGCPDGWIDGWMDGQDRRLRHTRIYTNDTPT